MREMGVADVRVGERMHQAAGAYFGRLMAYRRAMSKTAGSNTAGTDEAGPDDLAGTLLRNVLADTTAAPAEAQAGADQLARYARGVSAQLEGLSYEAIAAGMIPFPPSLA